MKKTKLMLFIVLLVIGIFFVMPVKVLANTADGTAEDWYNFIAQFDFGFASCKIYQSDDGDWEEFFLSIVEAPGSEFDGLFIFYDLIYKEDIQYFHPELDFIEALVLSGESVVGYLEYYFEDFDGFLYWNFEEKYWQIDYYNKSEFNNKEVDMVTDLLDTLAEIGAGIGDLFGKIVESVGQFFYTPGTGDNPGSFTIIGILTIAAVVISLSMWVLRLILRLFKLRG